MNVATPPRTLAERHKQPPNKTFVRQAKGKVPVNFEMIEAVEGKWRVDFTSICSATLHREVDAFRKVFAPMIMGEPLFWSDNLYYPHITLTLLEI